MDYLDSSQGRAVMTGRQRGKSAASHYPTITSMPEARFQIKKAPAAAQRPVTTLLSLRKKSTEKVRASAPQPAEGTHLMPLRPVQSEIGKRVRMPCKMQKSATVLSSLPKQLGPGPHSHTQADTLDGDGHRSQRVADTHGGRFNEKSLPGFDSIADNSMATLSQRLAKESVPELPIGRRKSSCGILPASIQSVQDAIAKVTEAGSQDRRPGRFKNEPTGEPDPRRKIMHQMSCDRHFASVGTRPKLGQPQLSFRSSLQLPPSTQAMASQLLNDHKNDERVGRLLNTYVGGDQRSGTGGLLIRRAVTKKAKQQQLKLALSKRQDKPKEEKVLKSTDNIGRGAITEPTDMFQLEASFGDPRQSSISPDRTSLEKEIENDIDLMQMSNLIDEKVRSDLKGRRKQPRSKFLTALDHSTLLKRDSSGSPSPVGHSSVNLAMNAANEGRLMCIPKCTHTHLLEHIPAAAYATNDYLPKTKKSSRSPRL